MLKIQRIKTRIYPKLPIVLYDILVIPVAWCLAYWLRYNLGAIPSTALENSVTALLILIVIQVGCYYRYKVYRGVWRFSSLADVLKIIKAVAVANLLTIPCLFFVSSLHGIPRSIWPMFDVVLVSLLCGGRLFIRLLKEKKLNQNSNAKQAKVLIVGAGQAGESLARDINRNVKVNYQIVGFVDDRPSKFRLEIHGVRVLGKINQTPQFCKKFNVDLIFIAIPSASSSSMRRIVKYCERSKVPFRTLPDIVDIASGYIDVNALREVKLEDLLGRDQVKLNWQKISSSIVNRRVVVTGGGGSIGSELSRQVAQLNPKELLIIDNSEFNLYKIEHELKEQFPGVCLQVSLSSVLDKSAVSSLFETFKPELVFHAAAYKHVPMLEDQVRVAVRNNILGTQVMAEASVEYDVNKFVLISTDKAVNPTNIMGTTKRVAEIYCQNFNQHADTEFITVRFGNVLGSAGSVVPLFKNQLKKGGPLTVTHPDISRYFMTIPEASRLILQAMVNGSGGEIFVLDMGKPIKISYLAEQLIRLSGKEPNKDIDIEYTGLRPGEKLFEELFHESEQLESTEHDKILKAMHRQVDWRQLTTIMQGYEKFCRESDGDKLLSLLFQLVPEYAGAKSVVEIPFAS